MRKVLLSLMICAPLALAQTQTLTYSYDGLPLPVYPNDWNTWTYTTILVPRSIQVSSVTATVQVQYSGVGDLNVYLWSAAGTRTKLLERNCGALQNIDTTFDDSAPSKFSDFCPVEAGRGPYSGVQPLANSRGENGYGYWVLGVENNGSGNTGSVTGFSISITGTLLNPPAIGPRTIVSTSSFTSGIVAPGDYLGIIGVNMGPVAGARADATLPLPTFLGQTTVTFDGKAAPLFFVSDKFIAVQAPFDLTPGSNTNIQVVSANGSSAAIPVPVESVNPGVLTYETDGRGQAKAINEDDTSNGDGSIISSQVPAAPGSTIEVYATGLGQLDPPIPAGTPPGHDLILTTVSPVTATINGRPARVTYSGAAPGQTGVYQVNIILPANLTSGAALLVLSVDGKSSQGAVTVQIK
jgi:uncharacterized protein (TIGR03437 family)